VSDVYYYGYRFYQPEVGRWVSPDPQGNKSNLYQGLLNNPIKYVDADGRDESFWPSGFNEPPNIPVPLPYPPWESPGPVPSEPGAYGPYYPEPDWFRNPADEGKPCCCKPPAELSAFGRSDTPGITHITMSVHFQLSGCFKDMALLWWTCWRPDGAGGEVGGVIPSCMNNPTCTFLAHVGPYITVVKLRYLSCENNIWVKHEAREDRTFHRTWWGGWK